MRWTAAIATVALTGLVATGAAFGFTGASGNPEGENYPALADAQTDEEKQPREPVSTEAEFFWAAGADGVQFVVLGNGALLDVPAGAARLVVTAEWTCASPACALEAFVMPDGTWSPQAKGSGTGSLRIELEDPQAGQWQVALFSDGPTAGVQGTVAMEATFGDGA